MKRFYIALLLLCIPSIVIAAPSITSTDWPKTDGQVLTINGILMSNQSDSGWSWPLSRGSFEGPDYGADGWSAGDCSEGCVYDTEVKLLGTKSFRGAVHSGGGGTCTGGVPFVSDHIYRNNADGFVGPIAAMRVYQRFNQAWDNVWDKVGSGYVKQAYWNASCNVMFEWGPGVSDWPTQVNIWINGNNHMLSLPAQLRADRWYCFELLANNTTHQYSFYMDGALVGTISDTPNSTTCSYLSVPIENACAQSGTPDYSAIVYVDGFAQAESRIYPAALVQISGDGVTWKNQPIEHISDSQIAVTLDLPTLTAGSYSLIVIDGNNVTSSTYDLSGGGIFNGRKAVISYSPGGMVVGH